jgi:hypothetical protein
VATLRIVGGEGVERMLELREARLQIGRGRENGLVLPGPEKGVSRTHAELRLENGRYVIVDLQSQNGTWVNGRRVERAEVPLGAEIALGEYRLTLQPDAPALSPRVSFPEARTAPIGELQMRERLPEPPSAPPPAAAEGPRWLMRGGLAFALLALSVTVWVSLRTPPAAGASGSSENQPAAGEPPAPAPAAVPSPAGPPETATAAQLRDGSDRPVDAGQRDKRASDSPVDATRAAEARVSRKPGESTEAWKTRAAALQTRYGYSKAALDRNDFAAAAGGFEAILLEEPGFRDAPRLLVQAQSGMRASANSLFKAGQKLDAAGDWMGALQKYEQARQIYSAIPGMAESLQRVRGKLRDAGTAAFNTGKQHEASGRPQEALKEYQKAVQWLAADDPNRHAAQARVDKLKRN